MYSPRSLAEVIFVLNEETHCGHSNVDLLLKFVVITCYPIHGNNMVFRVAYSEIEQIVFYFRRKQVRSARTLPPSGNAGYTT